jgi:glucosamine-6-phosphate deaminase
MEVIIRPSAVSAARLTAVIVARELRAKPGLVLGLATGCTMEAVYNHLVKLHVEEGLDFSRCKTFNLDEYVGLGEYHPHSYHFFMKERLFERVNINLRNTHVPDGLAPDLKAECAAYEKEIDASGGVDLQLLGIGLNGHLGFNEPHSDFNSRTRVQMLTPATRLQNAPLFSSRDEMPRRAMTMGVGTILEARQCVLLATGKAKAEIVAQAFEGPLTTAITASAAQLHPRFTVILDAAAASRLKKVYRSSKYGGNDQTLLGNGGKKAAAGGDQPKWSESRHPMI